MPLTFCTSIYVLSLLLFDMPPRSEQKSTTIMLPTRYVQAGEDAELLCNISKFAGKRPFTLAWHHVADGSPSSLSEPLTKDDVVVNDRYQLQADLTNVIGPTGRYDLTVYNIREEDSGLFICKVHTLPGSLHSYITPVFVGRQPAVTIFNYTGGYLVGDIFHVAENDSFSLCCHDSLGKPESTVEWYSRLSENLLSTGNRTANLVVANASLLRNSTRYECRAKNVYQVDKRSVLLVVEAKPAIIDWWPKDKVHTYLMRTETVKCRHRGSPVPRVTWQFKGENNAEFRNLQVFPPGKYYTKNETNFSLCIRNISRHDIGTYRCVLRNNLRAIAPDPEPPHRNFILTLAPLKPNVLIGDQNIYSNACFVNWTITASNIDYYVLYARAIAPYEAQSDEAKPPLNSYNPDYNYDRLEPVSWKNDNFSHIVDGVTYQSTRIGWKLFEGSRVLTRLLPQTNYEVKLQACYLGSCTESEPIQFRTKDETRPLENIPFAVTIKQKSVEAARAISGAANAKRPDRHWTFLIVMFGIFSISSASF